MPRGLRFQQIEVDVLGRRQHGGAVFFTLDAPPFTRHMATLAGETDRLGGVAG